MIAECVSMVAEGPDSDRESPAYEAGELPFLYPAMAAPTGLEPAIFSVTD